MIAQLSGTLASKTPTAVIIDCGGVGYLVSVSTPTSEKMPDVGAKVTLLTYLSVREDALDLFGFHSETERRAFRLLTGISGIGAKIALGILSAAIPADLQKYVLEQNTAALQRLPGIGKKTAERIIVELRDKIGKVIASEESGEPGTAPSASAVAEEAAAALVALGYNRQIAERTIRRLIEAEPGAQLGVEQLIRRALSSMTQRT